MRDTFGNYHPIINFLYFGLVLLFSMCLMNPICLIISLSSALLYAIYLNGKKAMRLTFKFLLPLILIAAVMNPAFNHEGNTILAYLPTGNPLTLESIAYGIAAALMMAAVILWFSCYNKIMTSDKFVYLFGRIIPALSLVLSMTLRFVPKFKAQFAVVTEAQRCVGRDALEGRMIDRLKKGITVLSIMLTWSLENAIETADSMKSRGYGLPGRTAFSIYRFDERDKMALRWLLFCGFYITVAWMVNGFGFRYFPTIKGVSPMPLTVSFQLVYLALCLTPIILNRKEDRKWNIRQQKQSVPASPWRSSVFSTPSRRTQP